MPRVSARRTADSKKDKISQPRKEPFGLLGVQLQDTLYIHFDIVCAHVCFRGVLLPSGFGLFLLRVTCSVHHHLAKNGHYDAPRSTYFF